jgi:hypothetical protein
MLRLASKAGRLNRLCHNGVKATFSSSNTIEIFIDDEPHQVDPASTIF